MYERVYLYRPLKNTPGKYSRNWSLIAEHVKTRNIAQVRAGRHKVSEITSHVTTSHTSSLDVD